jgi:hypothetical protein
MKKLIIVAVNTQDLKMLVFFTGMKFNRATDLAEEYLFSRSRLNKLRWKNYAPVAETVISDCY